MTPHVAPDKNRLELRRDTRKRAVETRSFIVQPIDERRSRSWCTLEELSRDLARPVVPSAVQAIVMVFVFSALLLVCYTFVPWLVTRMLAGA